MNKTKQAFALHGPVEDYPLPYSPALRVGDWVFVAGQGPLDPVTRKVVHGTIEEETRLTLENVKALVEAAGATMAEVVKTTVHLSDVSLFDRFNAVYREYFPNPKPVRTTVQSVLIGGIQVEIDVVAYSPRP
ncbi:MAG: RidA family protein [Armatimonadota bacterium]|nr:RidA family protein [Armatimonadota bacterium]